LDLPNQKGLKSVKKKLKKGCPKGPKFRELKKEFKRKVENKEFLRKKVEVPIEI